MAAVAFAIVRLNDLFAAVMLAGIFSLLSAALFTVMDAVDVAFTEAAVGAGVSTVLFVGTLALTRREEKPEHNRRAPLALAIVLITGAALVYGTMDMPRFGDPDAPAHKHVAPYYLEQNLGVPNVVTAVLASYRSYDTWGETTVILAAAVGVLLLLGTPRRLTPRLAQEQTEEAEEAERAEEAEEAERTAQRDADGGNWEDET